MSTLTEKLRAISERHDFLGKNAPWCPGCHAEQVQLVAHSTVPARWRCLICKRHFKHEPARTRPRAAKSDSRRRKRKAPPTRPSASVDIGP
jgi:transposase-like protein